MDRAAAKGGTRRNLRPLFSVFIDNLPPQANSQRLRDVFRRCGRIIDAYIPFKRRKLSQSKFGFVRFNFQSEAKEAISLFDGVWWMDHLLSVKIALQSFNSRKIWRKIESKQPDPKPFKQIWKRVDKSLSGKSPPSTSVSVDNAKALRNWDENYIGEMEIDVSWLNYAAVGILKLPVPSTEIAAILSKFGFHIKIFSLGGLKKLLLFDSEAVLSAAIAKHNLLLNSWFEDVYLWSHRETNSLRKSWLFIEGVPLHAWSESNFRRIAKQWGSVLEVHLHTKMRWDLEKGRVLIETTAKEIICVMCSLRVGNEFFKIRITEVGVHDSQPFLHPPVHSSPSTSVVPDSPVQSLEVTQLKSISACGRVSGRECGVPLASQLNGCMNPPFTLGTCNQIENTSNDAENALVVAQHAEAINNGMEIEIPIFKVTEEANIGESDALDIIQHASNINASGTEAAHDTSLLSDKEASDPNSLLQLEVPPAVSFDDLVIKGAKSRNRKRRSISELGFPKSSTIDNSKKKPKNRKKKSPINTWPDQSEAKPISSSETIQTNDALTCNSNFWKRYVPSDPESVARKTAARILASQRLRGIQSFIKLISWNIRGLG